MCCFYEIFECISNIKKKHKADFDYKLTHIQLLTPVSSLETIYKEN